jgi:crotonobetainyl-CoA:carnitine CoA-transferase CaiB-like acyl-CoA transferase
LTESSNRPLSGVRVVDISTSYAGPTASMYLGDMGAEVIKVERPKVGDDSRHWGPPFVGGESAWFLSANRNKRSFCLDFSNADGLEVLLRLLEGADVFIENLNPSKLERLGVAPAQVAARAPRVIYCGLSGFGLTGPDQGLPGYDLVAQARSGMMSLTGAAGGLPQRVSTALSDVVAGMAAAFAICAALREQAQTGCGQVIDVSLLESPLALIAPRMAAYLAGDPEPQPSGATDSVLAVYQTFPTADRPIVVAVGNDSMWRRFCQALELTELAVDDALATNAGRRERRSDILPVIAERLGERPAAVWLERLAEAGVPCSVIKSLSEVVEDPQIVSRDAVTCIEHPTAGPVRVVGSPWRFGTDGATPRHRPSPRLGADTIDVLREAGYASAEIDVLLAREIAWAPPWT